MINPSSPGNRRTSNSGSNYEDIYLKNLNFHMHHNYNILESDVNAEKEEVKTCKLNGSINAQNSDFNVSGRGFFRENASNYRSPEKSPDHDKELQDWQKKFNIKLKSFTKMSSPPACAFSNKKGGDRNDSRISVENTSFNQNFCNAKSIELISGLRPNAKVEDILLREGDKKKDRIKALERRVYDFSYKPSINKRHLSPNQQHGNVFERLYLVQKSPKKSTNIKTEGSIMSVSPRIGTQKQEFKTLMERSTQLSPQMKNILSGYFPLKHSAITSSRTRLTEANTSFSKEKTVRMSTNGSDVQGVISRKSHTSEDTQTTNTNTFENSDAAANISQLEITETAKITKDQKVTDNIENEKALSRECKDMITSPSNQDALNNSCLRDQTVPTLTKPKAKTGSSYIPSNLRVPYFSKRNKKLEKPIANIKEQIPVPMNPPVNPSTTRKPHNSASKIMSHRQPKNVHCKRNLSIAGPEKLNSQIKTEDFGRTLIAENVQFKVDLEEFDIDQLEKQTKIYDYILNFN